MKGEVDLRVGDTTYTLAFGINQLVELENISDASIIDIADWFADRSKLRAGNMRAALWAALQKHHPEIDLLSAGEIIGEVGLLPVVEKLAEAIQAAFPEVEASGKANPPDGAQAGTGKSS